MLRGLCSRRLLLSRAGAAAVASSALGYATASSEPAGNATASSEPIGNQMQFAAIKDFRQKLASGAVPLVGIGIQLTDPTVTDALCDVSDFLWFDLEHTPISPEFLKWHMMVAHGRNTPVIVRVPGPNLVAGEARPWGTYIKHALDANADGIVAPQIRSAADATSVVADCRYASSVAGHRRGFGPTTPMNYGRIPISKYIGEADAHVFVGVMIETTEALADIENICAVDGLDCVIIGANDLSAAMAAEGMGGAPYAGDSPEVQAAVDTIIATASRHGKSVAFSTRDPKLAAKLAQKGVQILHVGSDVLAAVSYQTKLVADIKSK